jgi:hypothetical protein
MMRRLRAPALALAWLLAATLIAAGSAGLVAGIDQLPGTPGRAELTFDGDRAATALHDAASVELAALSDMIDELGETGRRALASLPGRDLDSLRAALDGGLRQVDEIRARADGIRAALGQVEGFGPDQALVLSPAVAARHDRLVLALASTGTLAASWDRLVDGGLVAIELTSRLENHDLAAGEAARLGSEEAYELALAQLGLAEVELEAAAPIRDRLGNTTDTSVLDEWLARNARYDAALRALYEALIATGGEVTPEVQAAFDAEMAARARLPADSRALVIIVGEIGQGGMTQAVIAIEQVRGSVAAALEPPPSQDPADG